MKINLVIIEDDVDLNVMMSQYFKSCDEFHLTLSVTNIQDFLNNAIDIDIDIVLLDLMLPGINGVDGIPLILEKCPNVSILVNSVLEDNLSIFNALKRGASGYITKGAPLDSIKTSLINTHKGMAVMSQEIASSVLNHFSANTDITSKLTVREQQIAESLKLGMSYKMIAIQYGITIDAIRFHVRNIYKKLAINSKAELIHLMLKGKK